LLEISLRFHGLRPGLFQLLGPRASLQLLEVGLHLGELRFRLGELRQPVAGLQNQERLSRRNGVSYPDEDVLDASSGPGPRRDRPDFDGPAPHIRLPREPVAVPEIGEQAESEETQQDPPSGEPGLLQSIRHRLLLAGTERPAARRRSPGSARRPAAANVTRRSTIRSGLSPAQPK